MQKNAAFSCIRILLLDDSENDALLFEDMLEQEMGDLAQLKWCQSAAAANDYLSSNKVDLCLIDYHLDAGINGLQWAQHYYDEFGVMGPALLILTGEMDMNRVDAQASGDDSGIADFLIKQEMTAQILERAVRYATKQQRLLREMQLREIRSQLFFDHAREGIIVLDQDGRVTRANAAVEQLFDYAKGAMSGVFLSQMLPGFSMNMFRPMGRDARPLISSSSLHKVSATKRDGTPIFLEVSLGIIHSEDDSFYTASFLEVNQPSQELEEIRRQAQTDDLTGLMNRRYFRQQAEQELRRTARHPHPMTMMMLDIDHFKQVNDTYGHPVGDIVLRKVAAQLQQSMREQDLLCRWGGEEFLLLLPDSDMNAALILAERMRRSVEALSFEEVPGGITISIGVTDVDATRPLKEATQKADKKLYKAKALGRNRICSL